MLLAAEMGFASVDMPMAFACRNARSGRVEPATRLRTARAAKLPLFSPLLPSLDPSREPTLPNGESGSRPPAQASRPVSVDLETAGRLADEGKLKEEAEICRAHLRYHGASARAYYLLGLVHDADSQPQAAGYYRKALYLEPDHHETLWQLALLAQKEGDLGQASAFKRRAQRARAEKLGAV
jgi:chemotaxis protein methyltransferase WspC